MRSETKQRIAAAGVSLCAVLLVSSCAGQAPAATDAVEGTEVADAPNVPPPITRTHATKVTALTRAGS